LCPHELRWRTEHEVTLPRHGDGIGASSLTMWMQKGAKAGFTGAAPRLAWRFTPAAS